MQDYMTDTKVFLLNICDSKSYIVENLLSTDLISYRSSMQKSWMLKAFGPPKYCGTKRLARDGTSRGMGVEVLGGRDWCDKQNTHQASSLWHHCKAPWADTVSKTVTCKPWAL